MGKRTEPEPLALRMARVVSVRVWADLLLAFPGGAFSRLHELLRGLLYIGSVLVAGALGVTLLTGHRAVPAPPGLSVGWYAIAIGWFPGMMALGFFLESPLLPAGVLVLGIPLLLLAGLRGHRRT